MLKVTKARVCASMVVGKSCLERAIGIKIVESRIWGMKASDSNDTGENVVVGVALADLAEERYNNVL